MNPVDDQLSRLLRAAARGASDDTLALPYGLETRVTTAWRSARSANASFWDMTLLVRGLVVASLIMAVSFWPALSQTGSSGNPFAEFLQLTDSTVPADDTP